MSEIIKIEEANIGLLDVDRAKEHYNLFNKFKKEICKSDIDYGVIPGTKKPTLFKPGAEKLIKAFNLFTSFEEIRMTTDLEKGFIDYEYKVYVKNSSGVVIGEGIGSCNSWEDKYSFTGWRDKDKPNASDQAALKQKGLGKFRKKGNSWQWQQRTKKMPSQMIALKNTIQKMAKKRAFVDACLTATGGGEFFTQDIEDMNILPDVDNVITELNLLLQFAISKVSNREEAEKVWKLIPSLHGDEGVVSDFKELSVKFPPETNG